VSVCVNELDTGVMVIATELPIVPVGILTSEARGIESSVILALAEIVE